MARPWRLLAWQTRLATKMALSGSQRCRAEPRPPQHMPRTDEAAEPERGAGRPRRRGRDSGNCMLQSQQGAFAISASCPAQPRSPPGIPGLPEASPQRPWIRRQSGAGLQGDAGSSGVGTHTQQARKAEREARSESTCVFSVCAVEISSLSLSLSFLSLAAASVPVVRPLLDTAAMRLLHAYHGCGVRGGGWKEKKGRIEGEEEIKRQLRHHCRATCRRTFR